MLTRFTPEDIPIFRALLQIEIEIELRKTSSFLGPYSRSGSNSGKHPRFWGSTRDRDQDQVWDWTPEHILVLRALLEIKIEIEIKLHNTSSFLGLYSRSRSNSRTHPRFLGSTQDRDRDRDCTSSQTRHALHQSDHAKKLHEKGTNRQTDKQTHRHTDIATNRPTRPRGLSWWKAIFFKGMDI